MTGHPVWHTKDFFAAEDSARLYREGAKGVSGTCGAAPRAASLKPLSHQPGSGRAAIIEVQCTAAVASRLSCLGRLVHFVRPHAAV